MYEIIYDYDDEKNIRENFDGTWTELQDHIKQMRETGCYNIDATDLEQGEYDPYRGRERTSCTYGDYSPSNPWNAPGMSISDFI